MGEAGPIDELGTGSARAARQRQAKAREQVCGTSSYPTAETGEGLNNLDYAYIASELGRAWRRVPELLGTPTRQHG